MKAKTIERQIGLSRHLLLPPFPAKPSRNIPLPHEGKRRSQPNTPPCDFIQCVSLPYPAKFRVCLPSGYPFHFTAGCLWKTAFFVAPAQRYISAFIPSAAAQCAFPAAMCVSLCFLIRRVSLLIQPFFLYACRLLQSQPLSRLFGTPVMLSLRCKINAASACIPETVLTGAHAPIIISTVTAVRYQDPNSSVPVRQKTLPYGAKRRISNPISQRRHRQVRILQKSNNRKKGCFRFAEAMVRPCFIPLKMN